MLPADLREFACSCISCSLAASDVASCCMSCAVRSTEQGPTETGAAVVAGVAVSVTVDGGGAGAVVVMCTGGVVTGGDDAVVLSGAELVFPGAMVTHLLPEHAFTSLNPAQPASAAIVAGITMTALSIFLFILFLNLGGSYSRCKQRQPR